MSLEIRNKSKLIEKLVFYITLSFFFIAGLKSFQDYGISLDEGWHRETGLLYYEFIKGFIFQKTEISSMKEIVTGPVSVISQQVIFDLPIEFLIDLFDIEYSYKIYHLRHFINFFYFFISIYLFFKILRKRFSQKIYAYIGMLFLFLSPRIFGESFYNNMDIFFLSLTIINTYTAINLINKPSLKSSIFFSITAALAFDARIMALLFITVTYFIIMIKSFEKKNYFKKNFKFFSISIITFPLFIIVFWPYLWFGVLDNLIFYFQNIPQPPIKNFYFGSYLYPQNTPWHYNFVWILITSPITMIILFLIGLFQILSRNLKRIFKIDSKLNNLWNGNKEMYDSYFLYIVLVTFLSLIIFSHNFDGWRHVYFIYPFIIAISLSGVYFLIALIKNKYFKIAIFSIIFLEIFFLAYWNFRHHPHQYVFFNPIFKNYAKNNFDIDYWGLSNRTALEYIVENDNTDIIKVSRASFTSLETSLLILQKEKVDRIKIVHDLKKADYVIDNYRKGWEKIKNIELLGTKFVRLHDIKVDDIIISTIYKKN